MRLNLVRHSAVFMCLFMTNCMSSRQEEEMNKRLDEIKTDFNLEVARLREELLKKELAMGKITTTSEDASRKVQGTKGEVEDLKRQLGMTQGSLDELQTKFSRFVDASTKGASSDAQLKVNELEEAIDLANRKITRLQLIQKRKIETGKGRITVKFTGNEELEKTLLSDLARKEYKKIVGITTQILNSDNDEFAETSIRFRAEAHFASQEFEAAAIDLGEFVERYQRSNKYPRMLLLAGDSFVYLKNFRMARSYYTECTRNSPDKEECKAAQERLKKLPGS